MSWDLCKRTIQVARKQYDCGAAVWVGATLGWNPEEYDEEDRHILATALEEDCKILPGTEYVKVKGIWEGEFSVFRARKDLDYLCNKYELYAE